MEMIIPQVVAIYTRRSSTLNGRQEQSHERQTNELKSFCKRNNKAIIDEFSDDGTAYDQNVEERPGFMSMMNWLDKDAGHIVVMSEVSRLSRDESVWNFIKGRLNQFRFVEFGDVEPTHLLVSIFLSLAQQESERLGRRVKSAHQLREDKYGKGNFPWGNRNIHLEGEKGRETQSRKTREHWEPILILDAHLYKLVGLDQGARVKKLNEQGCRTRPNKRNNNRGRPITAQNLCRAHKQLGTGGVKEYAQKVVGK